jgi:hypothetical protein
MRIKFDSSPIIVIGMHRSGTSILTRMLIEQGVYMGRNFDPNSEDGFFKGVNQRIMNSLHATWSNPEGMIEISDFFSETCDISIRNFINKYGFMYTCDRYRILPSLRGADESQLWGWKDPVNTFTLPIWRRVFPNARVVHIYRHPMDVARSLQLRNEKIIGKFNINTSRCTQSQIDKIFHVFDEKYNDIVNGVELWKRYVSKCLSYKDVIHVKYEEFLVEPLHFLEAILGSKPHGRSEVAEKVDKDRMYAFLSDDDLVNIYDDIKSDELFAQLQYNDQS